MKYIEKERDELKMQFNAVFVPATLKTAKKMLPSYATIGKLNK